MFTPPAGKGTAAVAKEGVSKPYSTMEKPAMGKGEDHKAAIAKMHPEHLHKMVKAAHAGEYGPKAQAAAQQAMQSAPAPAGAPMDGGAPQDGAVGDDGGGKDYAGMFGMGSGASSAMQKPAPSPPDRASMFERSRGGM